MKSKFAGVFSCAFLFLAPFAFATEKPDTSLPPIQELTEMLPSADVFGDWKNPTQIKSAAEAEKYFEGAALATLKERIDFANQLVLVFAWRGSGQDKLSHAVAESAPEQITFTMQRGRTRDLRPHVHVFALRKDVKWSFGDGR